MSSGRRTWFRIGSLACVAVGVMGCAGGASSKSAGLPAPGETLPPLVAKEWLNGPPPGASEMAGHVVVVDVWAHWCGPCREEAPRLVALYHRYKSQGVLFVGLSPDPVDHENRTLSEAFVDRATIPWPNGLGAADTIQALGVKFLPSVIVQGADGKVFWNSELGGTLEEAIEAALKRAHS